MQSDKKFFLSAVLILAIVLITFIGQDAAKSIFEYMKNGVDSPIVERLYQSDIRDVTRLTDVRMPIRSSDIDLNNDELNDKAGTLSNIEARKWYLEQLAKIGDQIDKSLPLEQQAKQAFELRNQYRTEARALMADRKLADQLNASDPNQTWEEIVNKTKAKRLSGDDVWNGIIESSMRSRQSVNKSIGLEQQ